MARCADNQYARVSKDLGEAKDKLQELKEYRILYNNLIACANTFVLPKYDNASPEHQKEVDALYKQLEIEYIKAKNAYEEEKKRVKG